MANFKHSQFNTMKLTFNFIWILLILSSSLFAQSKNEISIIPEPYSMQVNNGEYLIDKKTKIIYDPNNKDFKLIAEMLSAEIKNKLDIAVPIDSIQKNKSNVIRITAQNYPDTLGKEGYVLSVKPGSVVLKAGYGNGAFYGMQSLLQLIPLKVNAGAKALTAVEIVDKPRFEWRGLMLDVGRYYYSMDFLKKFIDYLAMHKLNTFHWHLTEDHGWRIEIKKYPKLTEVGAWRTANQFDRNQLTNKAVGGFYTQDQARELVDYAAKRYVTVVPEIEMPGHTTAALVAYPELSCTGGPFKTLTNWGIQKEIFCAGNEQTFKFLEDVLSEIAAIFPSKTIHIGGDEAPKDRWKACAKCQQRIKQEGLKDEHELQSYFIKRIEKFLLTKNKNIIGWDEILEGGLAPNAKVMSWRGIKGGIEAAKQGHDVVMSPTDFMYLDYYQGKPHLEPLSISNQILTLKKVYDYEPIPEELNNNLSKHILGLQGNVWGEYIHTPEKAEYMTYPRAAALAEVGWSQAKAKNWQNFMRKMEDQYQRYDEMGLNYAKSAYDVWISLNRKPAADEVEVSFDTQSHHAEIRYTLDGNEPKNSSKLYDQPFAVHPPVLIKTATFKDGKMIGKVVEEAVLKQ
jgi:hexosaminidase